MNAKDKKTILKQYLNPKTQSNLKESLNMQVKEEPKIKKSQEKDLKGSQHKENLHIKEEAKKFIKKKLTFKSQAPNLEEEKNEKPIIDPVKRAKSSQKNYTYKITPKCREKAKIASNNANNEISLNKVNQQQEVSKTQREKPNKFICSKLTKDTARNLVKNKQRKVDENCKTTYTNKSKGLSSFKMKGPNLDKISRQKLLEYIKPLNNSYEKNSKFNSESKHVHFLTEGNDCKNNNFCALKYLDLSTEEEKDNIHTDKKLPKKEKTINKNKVALNKGSSKTKEHIKDNHIKNFKAKYDCLFDKKHKI